MGLDRRDAQGRLAPVYHLPLTKKMYETLSGNKKLISNIIIEPGEFSGQMYPLNLYTKWDRNNYGPIWIPAKGATIKLTEDNLPIYERCIVAYEGNKLEVKEAKTKEMVRFLEALKLDKRTLVVMDTDDIGVIRASRNIPKLSTLPVAQISTYEVVANAKIVLTKGAVEKIEEVYGA